MSDVSFKISLMAVTFTFIVERIYLISNFCSVVNSRIELTSYFMKTVGANVRTRYLTRLIEWNNLSKLSTIVELRIMIKLQCQRFEFIDTVSRINNSWHFQANNASQFYVFALELNIKNEYNPFCSFLGNHPSTQHVLPDLYDVCQIHFLRTTELPSNAIML